MILPRYDQEMPKKCPRYAEGSRYVQDKIFPKYAQDMLEICP